MSVLSALQSMERNRPPALLVRPDDALQAARSAMLLGSVVPDIHEQAEALGEELEALTQVRVRIEDERDDLRLAREALDRERADLAGLLAEKERLQKAAQVAVAIEAARVARFSNEARSLRDLVERLSRQGAAAQPRLKPRDSGDDTTPAGAQMAAIKGRLRPPVAGRLIGEFGDEDETGTALEGLTFRTRPGAQVVAPFDSTVVFAQPYRNYGQVLILAAGDGYHFVLTGLDHIYGVVGQELLAGEPVGAMGMGTVVPEMSEPNTREPNTREQVADTRGEPGAAPRSAQASADGLASGDLASGNVAALASLSTPQTPSETPSVRGGPENGPKSGALGPTLYFELRRGGSPVDPLPWLTEWTRPASG